MWPLLKHILLGWPKRYWLVETHYHNLRIIRACFAPSTNYSEQILRVLDGPFDTNEDAAHSLTFWGNQYKKLEKVAEQA